MHLQIGRVEFGKAVIPDERIAVLEYRLSLFADALLAVMKAQAAVMQMVQLASAQSDGPPN